MLPGFPAIRVEDEEEEEKKEEEENEEERENEEDEEGAVRGLLEKDEDRIGGEIEGALVVGPELCHLLCLNGRMKKDVRLGFLVCSFCCWRCW